ncbi:Uncharacterised protein [uncultured archaeon]|nr:Uncharacterised protein [uncultured archaeon]
MASKKRRKKVAKKAAKKVKRRRSATARVSKHSLGTELGLLQKIEKKVTRIDRTVNAGFHLKRKAKKAARRRGIEADWEAAERHGIE